MPLTFKTKFDLTPYREAWDKAVRMKAYVLVRSSFPVDHPQAHHVCGIASRMGVEFVDLDIGQWKPKGVPVDWLQEIHFLSTTKPTLASLRKKYGIHGVCLGIRE